MVRWRPSTIPRMVCSAATTGAVAVFAIWPYSRTSPRRPPDATATTIRGRENPRIHYLPDRQSDAGS
jgi:hypothetical protein